MLTPRAMAFLAVDIGDEIENLSILDFGTCGMAIDTPFQWLSAQGIAKHLKRVGRSLIFMANSYAQAMLGVTTDTMLDCLSLARGARI